jgi:hypothetical protein
MVLFPSGSISGTINNSVYINCCGSNIDLNQQSYVPSKDIDIQSSDKEEQP